MVAEGSDIHTWDSHSGGEGEKFFLLQRGETVEVRTVGRNWREGRIQAGTESR